MHDPSNPVGFDSIQAATSYVTFAATLAAIVFAAIILLLSNPPQTADGLKKKIDPHVFNGLLVAFSSLSIAAFLFIGISGTQPQYQTLALLLGIGADIVLSLAVLQLLLSLCWCFHSYGVNTAGVKWLLSGIILPAGVYLLFTIGDYLWSVTGTDWTSSQYFLPLLIGSLVCLLGLPLGVGWLVRILIHAFHKHGENDVYAAIYSAAIVVSAVLSIIVAATFTMPSAPSGKILGYQPLQANFPNPTGFLLNFPLLFVFGLCETLYIIGLPKGERLSLIDEKLSN